MTNYECCYSSGRQFIFTERHPRWIFGALFLVAFLGLCFGLFLGVTVSFGGVLTFELILFALAAFAALRSYYLCFLRASSSVDVTGYIIVCVFFAAVLGLLWAAVRYSLLLDLGSRSRCMLFGVTGLVLGCTIYGYVLVCCQEDERKHQLTTCSPSGDAFVGAGGKFVDQGAIEEEGWDALTRYLAWIFRVQCHEWRDFQNKLASNDEECTPNDCIIVHNRTLKLIKVCIYASDDLCCWVPVGGVSGRCVGFIQAEQSRAFSPPKSSDMTAGYRLKVFQPGLLDKELACYAKAQRGQSFAFFDVEGMIKRNRLLSSSPKKDAGIPPSWPESSESEIERDVSMERSRSSILKSDCSSSSSTVASKAELSGGSGGMKRQCSGEKLKLSLRRTSTEFQRCDNAGESGSAPAMTGARSENRRADPNEVVVRNRSNQEIRALLYRSTDYCYMVPLVGHLLACGDCILPDTERRFNPKGVCDKDFTVKVYSVGPAAKELTYLTVERGEVYTFCDSLLS